MTIPSVAVVGKLILDSCAEPFELVVVPLGNATDMLVWWPVFLIPAVCGVKKLLVAPESTMACCCWWGQLVLYTFNK